MANRDADWVGYRALFLVISRFAQLLCKLLGIQRRFRIHENQLDLQNTERCSEQTSNFQTDDCQGQPFVTQNACPSFPPNRSFFQNRDRMSRLDLTLNAYGNAPSCWFFVGDLWEGNREFNFCPPPPVGTTRAEWHAAHDKISSLNVQT
jgi:hypothetical protein